MTKHNANTLMFFIFVALMLLVPPDFTAKETIPLRKAAEFMMQPKYLGKTLEE